MAELLKNVYNQAFFDKLTKALIKVNPSFSKASFLKEIFNTEWESKELKQRMRHIAIVLRNKLAGSYSDQVKKILETIEQLKKNGYKSDGFELMFFPDFIELYGLEHYDVSIMAFEEVTQFVSCEFAVRPFIIQYEDKMLAQMALWSKHKHAMVRRLSTEGCRPRLPWAMALPSLKKDPTPIMPILEHLKNDSSESVRRSVANNLNDISKDNPDTVIELVKNWQGFSQETDWLIKHASRTLLKQGNSELMALFGFGAVDKIKINGFQILTPEVNIGDFVAFSFNLLNEDTTESKIRLEYGLYYQKANGSLSKKVFKISEKIYSENSTTFVHRKQSFKVITTRKFHLGEHRVAIIINGTEFEQHAFKLIE